ncbi:lytic polysaccharide monooxygenase auxiliary activity family 9 protein [Kitasatospora sp. NPDC054939]
MFRISGSVVSPASRAHLHLGGDLAAALSSGKFFPATEAGLRDPSSPDDVPNAVPPQDGSIASAGQSHAAALDAAGAEWKKHEVSSGSHLHLTWHLGQPVAARRFSYFLTRPGWDPTAPLSRAQFESEPILTRENASQPYWVYDAELTVSGPVTHALPLPRREPGHHVLLAVLEDAASGGALYQVVDLQFG